MKTHFFYILIFIPLFFSCVTDQPSNQKIHSTIKNGDTIKVNLLKDFTDNEIKKLKDRLDSINILKHETGKFKSNPPISVILDISGKHYPFIFTQLEINHIIDNFFLYNELEFIYANVGGNISKPIQFKTQKLKKRVSGTLHDFYEFIYIRDSTLPVGNSISNICTGWSISSVSNQVLLKVQYSNHQGSSKEENVSYIPVVLSKPNKTNITVYYKIKDFSQINVNDYIYFDSPVTNIPNTGLIELFWYDILSDHHAVGKTDHDALLTATCQL